MRKHKSKIKSYLDLKSEIARILYDIDPIGVSSAPEDEYSPEAELIIIELNNCKSIKEVYDLLVRVFVKMFGATFLDGYTSDKLHLASQAIYNLAAQNVAGKPSTAVD